MGRNKFIVRLTPEERSELEKLVSTGEANSRKITHARILLKVDADGPNWSDESVKEALDVGTAMVERIRKAFVEVELESLLNGKPRRKTTARKRDGEQETHLIALACGPSPEEYKRWTPRLLMVELEYVDTFSYETVRQVLKKTKLSLGAGKNGVFH